MNASKSPIPQNNQSIAPLWDQTPLFNLNYLELFGLKINSKCNEWDKFLDDFLMLRYLTMRTAFVEGYIESFSYFLFLVEGNFLMLKCDLISQSVINIKRILCTEKDDNIKMKLIVPDYLQLVNLGRIVFVFLIQTLYDNKVKINGEAIQKFMVLDSEIDAREKPGIKERIIKFGYVKGKMPNNALIGIIFI